MVAPLQEPEYFNILQHVPVFAILTLLKRVVGNDARFNNMSGEELIQEVRHTPDISEEDVRRLFEEYRYGGRACFYIYLFLSNPEVEQIPQVDDWNRVLAEVVQQVDGGEDIDITVKDIQQLREHIVEIRFKYQTVHKFIEPEFESATSVAELEYGFLWLNLHDLYMVLMVKEEAVSPIIERAVNALTRCIPLHVRLTKEFVRQNFNDEDLTGLSTTDPKNKISQRLSGDNLYGIMREEINESFENKDTRGGRYKEEIREGLESQLGLQLSKGKIYLTKTLSTTYLRLWMYNRLHPLILALKNAEPAQAVQMLTEPIDELDLEITGENIFREIAGGIIELRDHPDGVKALGYKTGQLVSNLRQYFFPPDTQIFCEECGMGSKVLCVACESDNIKAFTKGFECRNCGHTSLVPDARAKCIEGHEIFVPNPEECLVLTPKSTLLQTVTGYIRERTGIPVNPEEEFFWIDVAGLHYARNTNQYYFLPEDFDEVRRLPRADDIPQGEWRQLLQQVQSMKEKCRLNRNNPTKEQCIACDAHDTKNMCIPKLFMSLSADFSPAPHGGAEFGDVGMQLTLQGRARTFLGMAKSKGEKIGEGKVTHSSSLGKEWVSQIVRQALNDNRVEVFGIITPKTLDPEYFASIKLLAGKSNKPFVYFGEDVLTRMFYSLVHA
jgi:hypothetical protein